MLRSTALPLRRGIVVAVASALLVVPPLVIASASAFPAQADPPAVQADDSLKVMSFNIRYGTARDGDNAWNLRRSVVIEVIESQSPDVLSMQEALRFQLDELAMAMPRYQEIGVGRTDGVEAGEYAAILVDHSRLELLEQGTFWFSETPEVPGSTSWGNDIPRICTWARLRDRDSGKKFYVYNVHWDHQSQPSREESAELLMLRIAQRESGEDPVLVTGDFNAGESNPAFERLLAPGAGGQTGATAVQLRDTFRALHPEAMGVGTFNGFEGRTDGEKIDAVLASEGWRVLEAEIVRSAPESRYPSDHFPVVATVTLLPDRVLEEHAVRDRDDPVPACRRLPSPPM
jgi:endonuclease/exonuclease/phosphatase family metal-dependent hydrolase